MRRSLLILVAAAAPLAAQQQQSTPAPDASVSAVRQFFKMGHDMVLKSAEMIPEADLSFRPTEGVRTFGELVGHVADAEHMVCAAALGEQPKMSGSAEKTAKTKAALIQAMKDAGAYCDKAFAMTDAAAAGAAAPFGMQMTKMGALVMVSTHNWEHYGNLVTYLRMKGMTPPSSQR